MLKPVVVINSNLQIISVCVFSFSHTISISLSYLLISLYVCPALDNADGMVYLVYLSAIISSVEETRIVSIGGWLLFCFWSSFLSFSHTAHFKMICFKFSANCPHPTCKVNQLSWNNEGIPVSFLNECLDMSVKLPVQFVGHMVFLFFIIWKLKFACCILSPIVNPLSTRLLLASL